MIKEYTRYLQSPSAENRFQCGRVFIQLFQEGCLASFSSEDLSIIRNSLGVSFLNNLETLMKFQLESELGLALAEVKNADQQAKISSAFFLLSYGPSRLTQSRAQAIISEPETAIEFVRELTGVYRITGDAFLIYPKARLSQLRLEDLKPESECRLP